MKLKVRAGFFWGGFSEKIPASYESRNKSASRVGQLVPIGIPIVYWLYVLLTYQQNVSEPTSNSHKSWSSLCHNNNSEALLN